METSDGLLECSMSFQYRPTPDVFECVAWTTGVPISIAIAVASEIPEEAAVKTLSHLVFEKRETTSPAIHFKAFGSDVTVCMSRYPFLVTVIFSFSLSLNQVFRRSVFSRSSDCSMEGLVLPVHIPAEQSGMDS